MRITTLIENRPSATDSRLAAEWGLSLHVAFAGRDLLFDTGASGAFADNAARLCIPLDEVEAAVLSHHHYDHGGGVRRFFEVNSRAKVYLGPAPDGECVSRRLLGRTRYIGLDPGLLEDHAARFVTVREPVQILPGVHLLPCVAGGHPRPAGNKSLPLRKDGAFRPDDFAHEILMVIREGEGIVVFTGCSHNGILNVMDTVAASFAGLPIKAVVGGFHLFSNGPFRRMAGGRRGVEAIGAALLRHPVEGAYTCHCTGEPAFGVLRAVMGERIRDVRTGVCFDL
jgi:7,8-dihydropterin-6-yl-methyl-4-(beta-D-ribofuranosyl)aminobenzene 5'-phosphate synthase